jgi:hypothetical protein
MMRFIRNDRELIPVSSMRAEDVKSEFGNIEVHMGDLKDRKFKMKSNVTYEDELLIIDGGKRVAKVHARNFGKVNLEKKAIRIAAMNFEIVEEGEVSTVSGSIKLDLGSDSQAWYQELWG